MIVSTFAALSSSIQPTQAATTMASAVNYMSNGNAWTEPDSTLNADFARFKSNGITHVSIRVMWSIMMPSSSGLSTTAMNNLQRVLNAAQANGVKVNLDFWTQFGYTLGFPTSWAGNDYYSLLSNPTKGYYLSYMKSVVSALKGYSVIESWSILNEPYYSSSTQKVPFQNLIAEGVNAIKSVDNTRPVIVRFTLSYTPGSGKYDASVYDLVDAMAVTIYLDPSNPTDTRYNGRWSYWDKTVADCKARNMPLWVIEFGDDNTNTEHVKQHYQLSLEKFAAAGVAKAYAWAWQTRSASNEAFNIYTGSSPEPAYYELAKYPSTPSTNPTPTATPTQTPAPTQTPTPTTTPTPAPTATSTPTISRSPIPPVSSEATAEITIVNENLKKGNNVFNKVTVVVTVVSDGLNLKEAGVYGHWSGIFLGEVNKITTGEGKVTFVTSLIKDSGAITFTVDRIVKNNITYLLSGELTKTIECSSYKVNT